MIEGNPVPNDETYDNKINTNIVIPKETYQTVYIDDNLNENQEQNNYQEQLFEQKDEHKSKNYPSKFQENKFQSENADYHLSKPQMSNIINMLFLIKINQISMIIL